MLNPPAYFTQIFMYIQKDWFSSILKVSLSESPIYESLAVKTYFPLVRLIYDFYRTPYRTEKLCEMMR